jgi:hypothetical protein
MRWTRAAFARGFDRWARPSGLVSASTARRRRRSLRTAKPCGPGAPTLALSFRGSDFAKVTGAKEPGPRGARYKPLKPLRREGRLIRHTCGDYRVLPTLHAGRGCTGHPVFPAPSLFPGGQRFCTLRAPSVPRRCGRLRHGLKIEYGRSSLRESIPSVKPTDISGASMAPAPLTRPPGHGVYLAHAHRRPPSPSLVAHLVKGGRCDFRQFTSSGAAITVRRPCVCPVWRSLGKFRKRTT